MSATKSLRIPTGNEVREIEGWRREIVDTFEIKIGKIIGGIPGNLVEITDNGDLKDSDIATGDVQLRAIPAITIDTDYQILYNDQMIWVDASDGPVTVTLVDVVEGAKLEWIIEKIDASANKVIIAGKGADTINGNANFELLAQYESVRPQSTGTEYFI